MVNNNMSTVLLRLPNVATRAYGLQSPGQLARAIPRNRFLYFVEFNQSEGGKSMTSNANFNTHDAPRGISFKVKQIDKPKINLTTVELNQYNKKTLAYTKIDYGDVTMRLYDTVDDTVLSMWVDYFTYYFGDSRPKTDLAYDQSPVDAGFVDSTGWGLRPLTDGTKFFTSIRVYAFYANTYTSFSYMNPRITSVDWTQKEYSSSEPEEVNVTFKYEAIKYEKFGQPITDPEKFGWIVDNPDSLRRSSMVDPGPPRISQPRIFSPTQDAIPVTPPAMQPPAATDNVTNPNNNPTVPPGAPPAAAAPSAAVPQTTTVTTASATPAQGTTFGQSATTAGGTLAPGSVSTTTPDSGSNSVFSRVRRWLSPSSTSSNATGTTAQTTPIAPGGAQANANQPRMNITYDAMGYVTGTEPVESPQAARQQAVQTTSRQNYLVNEFTRQADERNARTRQNFEMIRAAAVKTGIIPADDQTTSVSGTIEANTVVTRVSANGQSVDLYPTLDAKDRSRVDNMRRMREEMSRER